jgi:hypothetical protein
MSTAAAPALDVEEWISRADPAELARCHEATIIRDVKRQGLETTAGPGGRVMVRLADLIRIRRIDRKDLPAGASAAGTAELRRTQDCWSPPSASSASPAAGSLSATCTRAMTSARRGTNWCRSATCSPSWPPARDRATARPLTWGCSLTSLSASALPRRMLCPGRLTESGPSPPLLGRERAAQVLMGGLGHREVGAVPAAAVPVGEGRGVCGFADMVGT